MRFSLRDETLNLAVWILDRALLNLPVDKGNLQLVGVAAIFIAAKFEEILVPNIADFVYVSADAFTRNCILEMERRVCFGYSPSHLHSRPFIFQVLTAIGYQCSSVNISQFLRRYQFHCSGRLTPFIMLEYIITSYYFSHQVRVQSREVYLSGFFGGVLTLPSQTVSGCCNLDVPGCAHMSWRFQTTISSHLVSDAHERGALTDVGCRLRPPRHSTSIR